jgi:hypothetical protein
MFGRRKNEKERKANERLAKRLLGRDSGRPTFGFKCSSLIQASIKKLAGDINAPIFSLSEHALELGMIQISEAIKDPEEREALHQHLTDVHVTDRTIEKIARYDKEASEDLTTERLRRHRIDNAMRQLVVKFGRWFHPEQLEELIDLGYRTKLAMAAGWPEPPDLLGGRSFWSRPRKQGVAADSNSQGRSTANEAQQPDRK